MSTIFCRLIFHDFPEIYINEFIKLTHEYQFRAVDQLITQPAVSLGSDSSEKKTEVQFSFKLKAAAEGPRLNKKEKYEQTCYALSELSTTIEEFRRHCFHHGLSESAIVTMSVLSKNIYPQFFQLQNVFSMEKLAFGSINQRRAFAPTFIFDEPRNERNEDQIFKQYLDEQRGLQDIGSNMLICFEHDRETLSICFPDVFRNWRSDNNDINCRSPNRVVDVRVLYAAIRRIVVTMSTEESGEMRVSFTFQLNYPPTIYVCNMTAGGSGEYKTKFKPPNRYLTWNHGHDIQSSVSHCSCLVADCRYVDARALLDCLDRLRKINNCAIEFRVLFRKKCLNIKNYERNRFMHPDNLPPEYAKLKEQKYFPLVYGVQALISRGGPMYDYFFRPEYCTIYNFLNTIIEHFDADLRKDPDARIAKTVIALENMLFECDKVIDIAEPLKLFFKLYSESSPRILADITDELDREGYMRVRKVIVTPTRKIFINPELIMGNRSLRSQGADAMLRVVFRDDDNHKITILPAPLITKTVANALMERLNIGFREFSYLCSSNSQLRDHGCYFLAGSREEVSKFRDSCGRFFKGESIPKMMSRMGQCFSQTRKLGIEIGRESYSEIFDYIGGSDSNGKAYTFSDGCGIISREFSRKISSDMKLGDCIPSCYQIRFRGYKGVVTVNSLLDETKIRAEKKQNGILPLSNNKALPWYSQSLIFRPSQKKFHGPREKFVEIVKVSRPLLLSLNKPLINILDQVSEMQGPAHHNRMCNRISELMEQHLERAITTLIDESTASIALNEFPKYILYDYLRDFNVTEEPFFRSMLRSAALVGLHRLVDKMKIRIPPSQGRMMFGVIDETGFLQSGQVFIQYTTNSSIKFPSKHANRTIHKGRVQITKNPSIVAGDVRLFDAVDIPSLHDLVDVVVFPQHGPRPHSDELSGSDLDGDEYSIFFDPMLFLDHNEPAFDYTPKEVTPLNLCENETRMNLTKHMINFFTLYVSQDSVGTIAHSHLANSDLYGINSKNCLSIALKHNQAVDFSKSGILPPELTKKWESDDVPPERVEKFPNFMAKNHLPTYKSTRLLGNLHSRAIEVREIIRIEEISSVGEAIKIDESVLMHGDSVYQDAAQSAYDDYRTLIRSICETYGIINEGQLFSGCFTASKKRLNGKDDDNMSNVQRIVEEQVATIYAKFRSNFFDEFGGLKKNTELDEKKYNDVRETFRRVCLFPSEQIRRKASAYYRVAYSNGQYLSFGWLVFDVLSYNRQKYLLRPGNTKFSLCPLIDYLSNYINQLCKTNIYAAEFVQFSKALQNCYSLKKSTVDVSYFVAKMCHSFIGLNKLLFFVRKWFEKHSVDYGNDSENDNNIRPKIMDTIVVLYGLGELKKESVTWLTTLNFAENVTVNLEEQLGGLGKRFWSLIQFLMSRNFGYSERISLEPVTKQFLEPSQCLSLFFAAEETFYPIAVSRRFDSLPGTSADRKLQKVTEGTTFIVEIPEYSEQCKELFENLAFKCGCKYLVLRKKPNRIDAKSCRIALKPVGSFMAVRKFRNILEVSPNMAEKNFRKRSEMIAEETYSRLLKYGQPSVKNNSNSRNTNNNNHMNNNVKN